MSWYVLKTPLGGPEEYIEYTYEETVTVRRGFVITENQNTATHLAVSNFDLLFRTDIHEEAHEYIQRYLTEEEAIPVITSPEVIPDIPIAKPAVGFGPQNKLEKILQQSVPEGTTPNVPWWSNSANQNMRN